MKKKILLTSLFFCILSTLSYTQSTTENESSKNLGSTTIPEVAHNQQKRLLTPEDYKLWSSSIHSQRISANGDWYSYALLSESNDYKLIVSSTKNNISYSFQSPTGYDFSIGGSWFGCVVPEKGMALLDLEKGTIKWMPPNHTFEFSDDDRYLVAHRKSTEAKKVSGLWIMNLVNGEEEWIEGVTEYLLYPDSNNLVYITETGEKKSVKSRTLEPSTTTTLIAESRQYSYKRLVRNAQGTTLAFFGELHGEAEKPKKHKLYYYSFKGTRPELQDLDLTRYANQFPDTDMTDTYLKISADGTGVFFKVRDRENLKNASGKPFPDNVQVWGARDKRIYSERERNRKYNLVEYGPKLAGWWPKKNRAILLETDSLPVAILTGDRKYMLSYDPLVYAPHFKYKKDINLYLTHLETGQCSLFLEQHKNDYGHITVSPGGKYIAYFLDGHWWAYDLQKKTRTNMTKNLGVQLYASKDIFSKETEFYGSPGWTLGDNEMIIYDQYDVWLLSPKGKAPERLSQGREAQMHHQIYTSAYRGVDIYENQWSAEFEGKTFNLSEGLVFKTLGDDMASGYSLWRPGKGLTELVYEDMHINGLKKARNQEAYIYMEQSFDVSPRIRYWEPEMPDTHILVGTNPQQDEFHWGRAELMHYLESDGKALQGVLFYPANYTAGKKYPMIVHIYERQSHRLHHYTNPSEYLEDGWNPTNYTADGYFVFLPDIKYQLNDPGVSAVQCIEAGVKAVLEKGVVDKDRIGLIGHSFGGYETAFAITQTDLFAVAVAGAASTDIISFYHSVDGDLSEARIFFFEDGQYRFRDSFYQNPAAYLRNSPLHQAVNINTPLLLWTGQEDPRVDWHQSISLYLGLRRMDKECELLIYPDEAHTVRKVPKNQVDLTRRVKKWFDKYLKGEAKKESDKRL